MSKAFDKVWHEYVLFKLKLLGLSGKYYCLRNWFLRSKHQWVVRNGQLSKWSPIKARVTQGWILGPLFFLLFINDLPNGLLSNPKLFADDTSIFSLVKDNLNSLNTFNEDLSKFSQWAYQWKMSFTLMFPNKLKKSFFLVKNINNYSVVFYNNLSINRKSSQKHLDLFVDEELNFS